MVRGFGQLRFQLRLVPPNLIAGLAIPLPGTSTKTAHPLLKFASGGCAGKESRGPGRSWGPKLGGGTAELAGVPGDRVPGGKNFGKSGLEMVTWLG